MPAGQQFAYIEGLASTRRLIKPADDLIAAPWHKAMTDLAESGALAGVSAAPRRSGRLAGKVYARVQKKAMPMWAAVRSRGTRRSKAYPRGYAYPRLLEFSEKHGHAGWFSRSVEPRLIGQSEAILSVAADEVERRWSRQ